MNIETQLFGTIEINEDKIITFEDGIIGFPDLQKFAFLSDEDHKDSSKIFWLQSMDDESFAMPIVDPFVIFDEYNPIVEDEWFNRLGEYEDEDLMVFLTMTVPEDITKMTVNQKAPLIINTNTKKACQIIVDGEDCLVRCPVYELLKSKNQKAGE